MPLESFSCQNFRCIAGAALEPHPQFSLITGPNASGKTSLLEAIAYLGRGRSFRGAAVRDLLRHGEPEFLLTGVQRTGSRAHRLGVRNGRSGLEISVDGDREGGVAALAAALPLQVIDPEVHRLVAGAPEERRRFVDWIAFHVEHDFLETWRRFRRALKQRNALLRSGAGGLDSWDEEFLRAGEALDAARRRVVERSGPALAGLGESLLRAPVSFDYHGGWASGQSLGDALLEHRERDRQAGTTQVGPHRGDLKLRLDERLARRLVSRGQQKLLASAMVLGSIRVATDVLGRAPLLLLDDPAAELDSSALERLMASVAELGSQVIATALTPGALPRPADRALFHVEQGRLQAA